MKRLVLVTMMVVLACSVVFAGAGQAPLNSSWATKDGYLPNDLGKVIYNVPAGKNRLNLNYVLQGATPNTNYTVGFDIRTIDCGAGAISWFGVKQDLCWAGTAGADTPFDTASIFQAGTVTTDADGDASFHINLLSLPSGNFKVLFWIIPCAPATACGYSPQAATGSWGGGLGGFQEIIIP